MYTHIQLYIHVPYFHFFFLKDSRLGTCADHIGVPDPCKIKLHKDKFF